MTTAYRILENGYFGGIEYYDGDGIPYGTTRTPVIDIPDGYYAVWTGTAWQLTDVTPPPIVLKFPDVQAVSMRQARRILFQYDMLSQIDIYISSLPSPDKELAQIDWQFATEVKKNASLVKQIASVMNITPDTIDKLFYEASLIGD